MLKPNYRFVIDTMWHLRSRFEYRKQHELWLFGRRFVCDRWHRVPKPFLNCEGGRTSYLEDHYVVTKDFEAFVKQWPDPADYMAWFDAEQAKLRQAYDDTKAAERALRGDWTDESDRRYFW